MERGASSARVLLVGGVLAALIAGGIAIGLLVGGSSGPDATATSPSASQPTTTSPSPTGVVVVRAQVRAAYLSYWDVYAQALLELDPNSLDDVLTGDALDIVREQVEEQRGKNQPIRIDVDHDIRITLINPGTASVDDRYLNRSVRLDPETMEPIEEAPNVKVHHTYTLKLVNGIWKVSFIIGRE